MCIRDSLESSLGGQCDVLEVAPAAPARAGEWARRVHAVGGRHQDLDRVGPQERRRLRRDPGTDPLAGQAVPHEDHPTVRGTADTAAPGGDRPHLEFEDVVRCGGRDHARFLAPPGGPPRRVRIAVGRVPVVLSRWVGPTVRWLDDAGTEWRPRNQEDDVDLSLIHI